MCTLSLSLIHAMCCFTQCRIDKEFDMARLTWDEAKPTAASRIRRKDHTEAICSAQEKKRKKIHKILVILTDLCIFYTLVASLCNILNDTQVDRCFRLQIKRIYSHTSWPHHLIFMACVIHRPSILFRFFDSLLLLFSLAVHRLSLLE